MLGIDSECKVKRINKDITVRKPLKKVHSMCLSKKFWWYGYIIIFIYKPCLPNGPTRFVVSVLLLTANIDTSVLKSKQITHM